MVVAGTPASCILLLAIHLSLTPTPMSLQLDLNRPMSSSQARLSSGASACLAVVDLPACTAHVCSVGDSRCLLARTAGNFNSVAPAGRFLGGEHALRNPEERAGLEGCMVCDGRTPGLHLTRALGFAGLKGAAGPAATRSVMHGRCKKLFGPDQWEGGGLPAALARAFQETPAVKSPTLSSPRTQSSQVPRAACAATPSSAPSD